MSRPSSPPVSASSPSSSSSNMHQISQATIPSSTRPSSESAHDLPYLRSDRRSSTHNPLGKDYSSPSSPTTPRPPPPIAPTRSLTLGSRPPSSSSKPNYEIPPRTSKSSSGHSPPSGNNDFVAPSPAWLSGSSASSRPGSSDDNHSRSSPTGLSPPSAGSLSGHGPPSHPPSSPTAAVLPQACSACGLPVTGQFVRALGTVYHLDCFRCKVSHLNSWSGP